jgi:aldose 1-epimerase
VKRRAGAGVGAQAVLSGDDWTVTLRPDIGGSIVALEHRGRSVLHSGARQPRTALETACFPLVPYANRIARGRFAHDGREWRVPRNFGRHPHALHGVGWQARWEVAERSIDCIALRHAHRGGCGWPWPYLAGQRIKLAHDAVELELEIGNRADEPMPVGLGFHPAFPLRADTVMQAGVGAVWLTDRYRLPTVRAAADHFSDWTSGAAVQRAAPVDNCHEAWNRRLRVMSDGLTTLLTASDGLDWLHIYIPRGRGYFCAEPVSHMPDALNRVTSELRCGARVLQPGAHFRVAMRITVAGRVNRPSVRTGRRSHR